MDTSKEMNSLKMKLSRAERAVITEQLVVLAAESGVYQEQLEDFATPQRIQQVIARSKRKLSKATFNHQKIKQKIRDIQNLESSDNS